MNDSANTNFNPEAQTCCFTKPMLELRSSIMGGADLRAEWMAEYGIEVEVEVEVEEEVIVAPVEPKRVSSRSLQRRSDITNSGWIA